MPELLIGLAGVNILIFIFVQLAINDLSRQSRRSLQIQINLLQEEILVLNEKIKGEDK